MAGLASDPEHRAAFAIRPAHTARELGLTYAEFTEAFAELRILGGGTGDEGLRAALVVVLGEAPLQEFAGAWPDDG